MKHLMVLRWIFILLLLSIPWIYLATIWEKLPGKVPIHFGLDGSPDKYGNKDQLIYITAILTIIALIIYFLLANIYKIDPKRYASKQQGIFLKIAMAMIVFMTGINIFVLHWTWQQYTGNMGIFFVLLGLLLTYLGNIMHSIKPNYFAGFRLPWTLESDANWKATHHFASKIWFAGGILITLLSLFIKPSLMFFLMMGTILIMVIIPIIFSYRFYKKEKAGQIQ
ncbi:MAG: SdpI family protein [Bacteroidetes bacterium]|nr:SdpI family protein [Bacteroidota bacterium]MBS1929741.1 SdpI family protein [Bacteroidota bacterium]